MNIVKKLPYSAFGAITYFTRGQIYKISILILLSVGIGLTTIIDRLFQQHIIDILDSTNSTSIGSVASSKLLKWVILYVSFSQLIHVLYHVYSYINNKSIIVIKNLIIDKLYNYVQYHSHRFFEENVTGNISYRITEAARSFEELFIIVSEKITRKTVISLGALTVMYTVNFWCFIVFLVWLCFFCGISLYFAKHVCYYSQQLTQNKAIVVGKIVDAISNINLIRMFVSYKLERKYLRSFIDKTLTTEQHVQIFILKLHCILGISCSIMCGCIMYTLIYLRENNSIGDFVLVLGLSIEVIRELWDVMMEVSYFYQELGNFNQCMSLLQSYIIQDAPNAQMLKVTDGSIVFRNVSFQYKEKDNIFTNQSIIIHGKQKVGLVGFSGSGKTTFISLISRLHDVIEGQIMIDGQDIRDVTQNSLRRNISLISQEPALFHRTIKDNIAYGADECSDEAIIFAAKKANIHDFIMELPEKYNTICGEGGKNLSGGQRQRIAIARAILKNAPILILDEATSALDSVTEKLIQQSLSEIMENKTVLVIAHRLSTILNMDRILVFDKGKIVEDGPHATLIRAGKLYPRLWNSQV